MADLADGSPGGAGDRAVVVGAAGGSRVVNGRAGVLVQSPISDEVRRAVMAAEVVAWASVEATLLPEAFTALTV